MIRKVPIDRTRSKAQPATGVISEVAVDTAVLYDVLGRLADVRAEQAYEEADERLENWNAERHNGAPSVTGAMRNTTPTKETHDQKHQP